MEGVEISRDAIDTGHERTVKAVDGAANVAHGEEGIQPELVFRPWRRFVVLSNFRQQGGRTNLLHMLQTIEGGRGYILRLLDRGRGSFFGHI